MRCTPEVIQCCPHGAVRKVASFDISHTISKSKLRQVISLAPSLTWLIHNAKKPVHTSNWWLYEGWLLENTWMETNHERKLVGSSSFQAVQAWSFRFDKCEFRQGSTTSWESWPQENTRKWWLRPDSYRFLNLFICTKYGIDLKYLKWSNTHICFKAWHDGGLWH